MKNNAIVLIGFIVVLMLNSCAHTPQKIERYIKNHCDLRTVDTCFIDLNQALETDYDTMYVFNSLIPLTGIQNIIGIKDYGKCKNPEMTLIGHDSETCRIILVKNNKVVYDDEYNFNDYNTKISFRDFSIVYGEGLFDGSIVKVSGYIYLDQIFMVTKKSDGQYLLEITEGVSN